MVKCEGLKKKPNVYETLRNRDLQDKTMSNAFVFQKKNDFRSHELLCLLFF